MFSARVICARGAGGIFRFIYFIFFFLRMGRNFLIKSYNARSIISDFVRVESLFYPVLL